MPKAQRTFTRAFKVEAVQLAQASQKSQSQIARELGIADSTLHHWRKQFAQQGEQAFPGGTPSLGGGEFAQPFENVFRAGFLLIGRSREGASCCRSTHLSLFSPSPSSLLPFREASSHLIHAHGDAWHRREGMTKDFSRGPSSVCSSSCHGWSPLPVAVRHQRATWLWRLHERHAQRCMGTHKMIVSPPPLQLGEQVWALLGRSPGAASQRCHAMTNREIHPLNESGVQSPRKTDPL
jgi:transposase